MIEFGILTKVSGLYEEEVRGWRQMDVVVWLLLLLSLKHKKLEIFKLLKGNKNLFREVFAKNNFDLTLFCEIGFDKIEFEIK